MNTSDHISSFPVAYPPMSYEIQLKDHILGIAVGLTEWIQRELIRLQKNELPRHCESYETLIEVIDDPSRFQMGTFTPSSSRNYYSSSTEEDDEDEEETSNDANSSDDTSTTSNSQESDKNITSETQRQSKNMLPPPTWLCKVFVEFIRYCNRGSITSTTIHSTAPKQLLDEFENLRSDKKDGKPISIPLFKEKLLAILFGKIQLTQYLVKSWKLMCEWVSKTQINDSQWLELSQSAYFIAQRLCIYETTHHRLQQQSRQKKQIYSTFSP